MRETGLNISFPLSGALHTKLSFIDFAVFFERWLARLFMKEFIIVLMNVSIRMVSITLHS